jgi:hypothetical protein
MDYAGFTLVLLHDKSWDAEQRTFLFYVYDKAIMDPEWAIDVSKEE